MKILLLLLLEFHTRGLCEGKLSWISKNFVFGFFKHTSERERERERECSSFFYISISIGPVDVDLWVARSTETLEIAFFIHHLFRKENFSCWPFLESVLFHSNVLLVVCWENICRPSHIMNYSKQSLQNKTVFISFLIFPLRVKIMIIFVCSYYCNRGCYDVTNAHDPLSLPTVCKSPSKRILSPGLVVMGGNSRPRSCGFKSRHRILDRHFSHLFVIKIVMFVWKDRK